ncbi:MAG: LON peptidase substrate-binding domain-containing protein [Candidatus Kapaibacterium sp.]
MESIGLFPLGVVLFPSASLPLHIFEPRYRNLLNTAIEKQTSFGINLVESSKLFEIGCSARVREVVQRYPDGRFDVIVTGEKRYHLQNFTEGNANYFVGSVEYFEDVDEVMDSEALWSCIEKYNRVVEIVFPDRSNTFAGAQAMTMKQPSFYVAQKSGLSLRQKQDLLEMRSENARLLFLNNHLDDILPKMEQQEKIRSVISGDGYMPPKPGKW